MVAVPSMVHHRIDARPVPIWHRPEWGEEFAATVHRNVAQRGGHALALVVEAGFKTEGYMPGDPLRRGAIVRVGAALIPTSRQSP